MLPSQPGEESGHLVDFYKTRPLLRHRYGKSRHSEHAVSVDPTKQSKRVKVLNGDEPEISKPRKNVNFAAGDDAKGMSRFIMLEGTFIKSSVSFAVPTIYRHVSWNHASAKHN